MAESAPKQITGDDIISELIRNADAGVFKVRRTILLPCRFNVYLHGDDFELIQPIAHVVRREAKQALAEHLAGLNTARPEGRLVKKLGLGSAGKKPEYKILEPDWSVEFHREEGDRLRPGDIEIYSDLGTAQKVELGAGAKTTFVTRHANEDPFAPSSAGTPQPGAPQFATLRYGDEHGERVFAMTREEIVVGRGGKAVWVDLKLEGPPDISREHCRIRCEQGSGRFFIKDLSQYGTAVDGTVIPTSIERSEHGDRIDRNVEVLLPSPAKITLAGVLTIQFQAKQPE